MTLKDAALKYRDSYGWTCHPLRRNEDGFPKIPITQAWEKLTTADVDSLDWQRADGLGIVLGAASGNLAAIDIDDSGLAHASSQWLLAENLSPLFAWTARHRGHVYCLEATPSASKVLAVMYQTRKVGIELKAAGTQIAAPPSPGYSYLDPDFEPLYMSVGDAWARLFNALGLETFTGTIGTPMHGASGYPRPWQEGIDVGERNNACFVESCRLHDAGMAQETALQHMIIRFGNAGLTQREIAITVRSAFNRESKQRQAAAPSRFTGPVDLSVIEV